MISRLFSTLDDSMIFPVPALNTHCHRAASSGNPFSFTILEQTYDVSSSIYTALRMFWGWGAHRPYGLTNHLEHHPACNTYIIYVNNMYIIYVNVYNKYWLKANRARIESYSHSVPGSNATHFCWSSLSHLYEQMGLSAPICNPKPKCLHLCLPHPN